jgi:hypothetical protein
MNNQDLKVFVLDEGLDDSLENLSPCCSVGVKIARTTKSVNT